MCQRTQLVQRRDHAVDVLEAGARGERQRERAVRDVLGVGKLAALAAEALGVEAVQVQREEVDAGGDAALAQGRGEIVARPAAQVAIDEDGEEVVRVRRRRLGRRRQRQRQVGEAVS